MGITMTTAFPSSPVAMGSRVSLTCKTDSANPPAQIWWRRNNENISDGYMMTSSIAAGEFYAMYTISTLSFTASEQHRGNIFECVAQGKNQLLKANTNLLLKGKKC